MEYPRETFKKLAQELRNMAVSPEVDLVICFPGVDEADCEEPLDFPYVIIRYIGGDEEGPEKKLIFGPAYWNSSLEALKGAVLHQIKSLMEELQSFEGE